MSPDHRRGEDRRGACRRHSRRSAAAPRIRRGVGRDNRRRGCPRTGRPPSADRRRRRAGHRAHRPTARRSLPCRRRVPALAASSRRRRCVRRRECDARFDRRAVPDESRSDPSSRPSDCGRVRSAHGHRSLPADKAAIRISAQAIADKLGITETEWNAIEGGHQEITLTFFRRLSDRLRIPRATLLRRTRPALQPMPMDFRTFDGHPAVIGFETRLAISYAQTIKQNILELVESDAAPPTPVLPAANQNLDAVAAGEQERRRLGITGATQLAWPFVDAFKNWRTLIESRGVYVLLQKFVLDDCRGFTIFRDANAPIIVINKTEDHDPARTFTLLHEYAHLLLRQPGISDQNDANPVEAFCNRFASGFLMPRTLLADVLPYWPDRPVEWEFVQVQNWARQLKVSQQALALRLEGLGVAPVGFSLASRPARSW